MVYAGIDVGGTGIQVGVVDEAGHIIAKSSMVTEVGVPYQEQIAGMARCVQEAMNKAGLPMSELKSVGAGVPGLADQKTGMVAYCPNIHWTDVPFREEFQKHIDKPVFIDNDATVAGLAESVAGVSAGSDSSVFLTLGTGVGGGIIIHGKVWSGFHGVGSEIGHITMALDGEPCNCGNLGCLERYCSATAIIDMARKAVAGHPESQIMTLCGGDPARINAKMVFDAAREGDETASGIFHRYVSHLAQAINTVINFLDPEIIVLGGGVSKAGDFLLDAVRREIPQYILYKSMPYARIELAQLGPDSGIIGAAMLGL